MFNKLYLSDSTMITNLKMNHKLQKAFTLIELLVVISIIGILAALAVVSFTSTQKQARDTERKSDLKQYQNSLEVYANKNNGLYPAWSSGSASMSMLCSALGISGTCPNDPKYSASTGTPVYSYQTDGSTSDLQPKASQYVLWAKLENVSNTFWVVCSTGQSGKIASSTSFSGGACPSGLTQ